jgi:hypothetical protein
VLSTVSNASRPTNRATPSQAPNTTPAVQAMLQLSELTHNERPTMDHSTGSALKRVPAQTMRCQRKNSSESKKLRYRNEASKTPPYEPPCIASASTTPSAITTTASTATMQPCCVTR